MAPTTQRPAHELGAVPWVKKHSAPSPHSQTHLPISPEGRRPQLQAPATKPSAHNAGHVFAAASTDVKPAPGVNTPAVSSMDGVTVNTAPHFSPASLSIYSGGHVDGEHEVLLVGDSIMQFVEVPNGITYCLQGAKILDIIELVPALIDCHLTYYCAPRHE